MTLTSFCGDTHKTVIWIDPAHCHYMNMNPLDVTSICSLCAKSQNISMFSRGYNKKPPPGSNFFLFYLSFNIIYIKNSQTPQQVKAYNMLLVQT